MPVHVIEGEDDKLAAFKLANAALAASGTVTLELGLAGTPMVVGYIVDPLAARLRFLVKTQVFALANLVHGGEPPPFPELMQEDCTPDEAGRGVGASAAWRAGADGSAGRTCRAAAYAGDPAGDAEPVGRRDRARLTPRDVFPPPLRGRWRKASALAPERNERAPEGGGLARALAASAQAFSP